MWARAELRRPGPARRCCRCPRPLASLEEAGAVPGRPGARPGEGTGRTGQGWVSSFPLSLELSQVRVWRFGFFAAVAASTRFLVCHSYLQHRTCRPGVEGQWEGLEEPLQSMVGGADAGAASVDGDKTGGRRPLGVWTPRAGRTSAPAGSGFSLAGSPWLRQTPNCLT